MSTLEFVYVKNGAGNDSHDLGVIDEEYNNEKKPENKVDNSAFESAPPPARAPAKKFVIDFGNTDLKLLTTDEKVISTKKGIITDGVTYPDSLKKPTFSPDDVAAYVQHFKNASIALSGYTRVGSLFDPANDNASTVIGNINKIITALNAPEVGCTIGNTIYRENTTIDATSRLKRFPYFNYDSKSGTFTEIAGAGTSPKRLENKIIVTGGPLSKAGPQPTKFLTMWNPSEVPVLRDWVANADVFGESEDTLDKYSYKRHYYYACLDHLITSEKIILTKHCVILGPSGSNPTIIALNKRDSSGKIYKFPTKNFGDGLKFYTEDSITFSVAAAEAATVEEAGQAAAAAAADPGAAAGPGAEGPAAATGTSQEYEGGARRRRNRKSRKNKAKKSRKARSRSGNSARKSRRGRGRGRGRRTRRN